MDPAALKTSVLTSIRDTNKIFYGMVIAQAVAIEVEGASLVFTFIPVHKTLRLRLEEKRTWIERLAEAACGHTVTVTTREVTVWDPTPHDVQLLRTLRIRA